jgi:hypothetical protein
MKQKDGAKTVSKPVFGEHPNLPPGVVRQLEHVRVSELDRELAREYLRSGERMAELIRRASENLRSAGALVGKFIARAK